jgi:ferredoxin
LSAPDARRLIFCDLQGWSKRRTGANQKERGTNMKVRVDKDTCVGDETCVEVCPEIFEMQGDVAMAKTENVPKNLEEKVNEAAKACPVEAIIVE